MNAFLFTVMPKRHGELKEYSIGPSNGATANCAQVNEGWAGKLKASCKIDTQSLGGIDRRQLR